MQYLCLAYIFCMLHNAHCVLLEFVSCSLLIMFCSCLCIAHCFLCFVYVCYILLTAQYVLLMFSICCSLLGMTCLHLYVALCVLLCIARYSVCVVQDHKLLDAHHFCSGLYIAHCYIGSRMQSGPIRNLKFCWETDTQFCCCSLF